MSKNGRILCRNKHSFAKPEEIQAWKKFNYTSDTVVDEENRRTHKLKKDTFFNILTQLLSSESRKLL